MLAIYLHSKHVYLKTAILIFFGISLRLSASGSLGDSINRLESRLIKGINISRINIKETKDLQAQINMQLTDSQPTKRRKSELEKKLKILNRKRSDLIKIENAYLMLLSESRKLVYLKDQSASKSLKKINKALLTLENNRIPSGSEYKVLEETPLLGLPIQVYDHFLESACQLTQNEDGSIWANEFSPFFEYTDPRIGNYFKEGDFLECLARFIQSRKKYYLELKFVLHSPKAAQLYGSIDPSNPARLDFLNGDFIYLETFALNTSELEASTGNTIITIQYKLDKEDLNYLLKNEVDAFTIIWTNGADRFELIYLDVLKNMLECLKKRN